MSKEIMRQALNVLHNISNSMRIAQVSGNDWRRELKLSENASNHLIEALEAELAKPEQPQTENILYLLSAWERGAYAEEYANEIEALRQAIKEQL